MAAIVYTCVFLSSGKDEVFFSKQFVKSYEAFCLSRFASISKDWTWCQAGDAKNMLTPWNHLVRKESTSQRGRLVFLGSREIICIGVSWCALSGNLFNISLLKRYHCYNNLLSTKYFAVQTHLYLVLFFYLYKIFKYMHNWWCTFLKITWLLRIRSAVQTRSSNSKSNWKNCPPVYLVTNSFPPKSMNLNSSPLQEDLHISFP